MFGKITIIQQTANSGLKEISCYSHGPVKWSFSTNSGELIKTSKPTQMHEIENQPTCVDIAPVPVAMINIVI